jgi:hypothetical protein
MKIDLCNKLVDNDLTKEELLERVEIQKTKEDDFYNICHVLTKAFNLEHCSGEAAIQLVHANVLINESIKLVDKETLEIYGLLMFCEYPISIGSPIINVNKELSDYLGKFRQVNGHSFIIDERLRGTGLDKKMLFHNINYLAKNYDMIWIGVEESLKTKHYWERIGFIKLFEIPEAFFYMIPFNEKLLN